MRYLLPFLVLFGLITSCAHHIPAAPPTSGYFGRIHEGKPVFCVDNSKGEGLTTDQCKIVQDAIRKVNAAVGYELFHFAGWYQAEKPSDLPDDCTDLVLVATEALPEPIAGVTIPQCTDGEYIMGTVILLSPDSWAGHADFIFLHELCHAAGLMHAEAEGLYSSVMKPKDQPHKAAELSPGDVASLRAGYEKK